MHPNDRLIEALQHERRRHSDPLKDLWVAEALLNNVISSEINDLSKIDQQRAVTALRHIIERALLLYQERPSADRTPLKQISAH